MSMVEHRQAISRPHEDEVPRPLGSEELRIDGPIIFRRGPLKLSSSSIIPLARLTTPSISYGPKLTPVDLEPMPQQTDCPFCYPSTEEFLQDPRYTWSEARWCPEEDQRPLASQPNLYVGVRPDYYSHFQHVIFRTDKHDALLKHVITPGPDFLCDFLTVVQLRSEKLQARPELRDSLGDSLLIGGVSFGISWPHFHVNMGICPSWTVDSFTLGQSWWNRMEFDSLSAEIEQDYRRAAAECEGLKGFPRSANLIVEDKGSFLWLVDFAGRTESDCTVISMDKRRFGDLDEAEIKELARILWTILCYYHSTGAGAGKVLLGFHSAVGAEGGGRVVVQVSPARNIGYIECFHGAYMLADWPENVAARLRAFKPRLPHLVGRP